MAIVFVNSAVNAVNDSTASTTIAAPALSCAAGNFLFVLVKHGTDFSSEATITDTAGNAFTRIGSLVGNSPNLGASEIFYAKNITGNSGNIITATFGSPVAYREIIAAQWSGIDTTSPLDAAPGAVTAPSAATSLTSASFSTSQADELIVGVASVAGSLLTFYAGSAGSSPMSIVDGVGGSSMESLVVSSIQSGITASMSWSASSAATFFVASFKGASSGGTTYNVSSSLSAASSLIDASRAAFGGASSLSAASSLTDGNLATRVAASVLATVSALAASGGSLFAASASLSAPGAMSVSQVASLVAPVSIAAALDMAASGRANMASLTALAASAQMAFYGTIPGVGRFLAFIIDDEPVTFFV